MRWLVTLLALFVMTSSLPRAADTPRVTTRRHTPPRSVSFDSKTVAVQVMLDRANFSPGEVDGRQGMNLERALPAFQSAERLPASGVIDDETWKRLSDRSGNRAPFGSYTITSEDVAGPFTPDIPTDLVEQATLDALGFRT